MMHKSVTFGILGSLLLSGCFSANLRPSGNVNLDLQSGTGEMVENDGSRTKLIITNDGLMKISDGKMSPVAPVAEFQTFQGKWKLCDACNSNNRRQTFKIGGSDYYLDARNASEGK